MQAYDGGRFDPPAPLALVSVKSEQLGVEIHDVPMLLDTGADVSLLPRSHVAALASSDAGQYELEAFDRTKAPRGRSSLSYDFSANHFAGSFCWLKVGMVFLAGMC